MGNCTAIERRNVSTSYNGGANPVHFASPVFMQGIFLAVVTQLFKFSAICESFPATAIPRRASRTQDGRWFARSAGVELFKDGIHNSRSK